MKPQTPLEEDWLLPNVFVRRMACKTHVGHTDCYSYFLWLSNAASAEANTPHGSFFLSVPHTYSYHNGSFTSFRLQLWVGKAL